MYICGYSCQGGTYFQMGKSSSKADEVAQRQALLTEIKRGKSHPEICISFYFNCVLGVEEVAGSLMEVLEGQVGNTIQLEVCLW